MPMRTRFLPVVYISALVGLAGRSQGEQTAAPAQSTPAAQAKPALNVKPFGTADSNFKPDYSKLPPDLQKVFAQIDTDIDEHVETLRRFVQQPSISNSGEGIPEAAEMVKGFFEELGCQDSRVVDT